MLDQFDCLGLYWIGFLTISFLFLQDLPNAMNVTEITEKLGLNSCPNRKWYVQATAATSEKDGIYEGLDWLSIQLTNVS